MSSARIRTRLELFHARPWASLLTWGDAIRSGITTEDEYDCAIWAMLALDAPSELREWWAKWTPPSSDPTMPALVQADAQKRIVEAARDQLGSPQAMRYIWFEAA